MDLQAKVCMHMSACVFIGVDFEVSPVSQFLLQVASVRDEKKSCAQREIGIEPMT